MVIDTETLSCLRIGPRSNVAYASVCAKNGNNVEATFDFVEKTKFYDTRSTLLPFVATKSNVA